MIVGSSICKCALVFVTCCEVVCLYRGAHSGLAYSRVKCSGIPTQQQPSQITNQEQKASPIMQPGEFGESTPSSPHGRRAHQGHWCGWWRRQRREQNDQLRSRGKSASPFSQSSTPTLFVPPEELIEHKKDPGALSMTEYWKQHLSLLKPDVE